LPSGDFTNRLKASFDRKGAAISALLGSVNLPIVSEIASSLESVVESSLSMENSGIRFFLQYQSR
jgi:hypothetical protein